jgi:hypothetical protein
MACRISIVVLICLVCVESETRAYCIPPTSCYCNLAQMDCSVLIYAEVTESNSDHISLKVIGEPAHDPDNVLDSGQIIENVNPGPYDQSDLGIGVKGLFSIFPEGLCGVTQASIHHFVAEEVDGIFLCSTADEFPGVTKTELVPAVLDVNCSMIVQEWGIDSECGTRSGGCLSCEDTSLATNNGLYIVLAGVFLVPGRRRRKRRK